MFYYLFARALENTFNNQNELNEFAFSASFSLLYESVSLADKNEDVSK